MLGKVLLGLALALLLVPAAHAASFDCTRARTPFAQAICTHPDLSKADDTLAATFKAALDGLSAPAAAEVSADHDAWVRYANIACTDDAKLATRPYDTVGLNCLRNLFTDRTVWLKNSRTLGGLRFYYVDHYEALRTGLPKPDGVATKSVSTPRIDANTPEAAAFNLFVSGLPDLMPDSGNTYANDSDSSSLVVTGVVPARITMKLDNYLHPNRAAHGRTAVTYVHYLRDSNRRLVAGDVFSGNGWQQKLKTIVLAAAKKAEGGDSLMDDADVVGDSIVDPARWDFSKAGLIVQFEPYEIAPYAAGAPTVTIPWADIAPLLAHDAGVLEQ